jgi:hypothetical protein
LKLYKSIGNPVRPLRLFIGGVHGKECRTTKLLLERLVKTGRPMDGSAIVIPCLYMGKYVTTLSLNYLSTKACKRLVKIVEAFKPDMYVEVHCYKPSSYNSLISPSRIKVKGVPPLVELEGGVLIGSISPLLKAKLNLNMPVLIETPCGKRENFKVALRILYVFLMANSTSEALETLGFKHRLKDA